MTTGPHGRARTLGTGIALLAILIVAAIAILRPANLQRPARFPSRPNIVLITTDDQPVKLLWVMRRTRRAIGAQGTQFRRYYASFPLCCPARATWITGQYAHNHGVIDNRERNGGGYAALRRPMKVLPVWLRSAGYETALSGKWLHDYDSTANAPGWETFHALVIQGHYYDYALTDSNGGAVFFGQRTEDYVTDTLTNRFAVPFIRARAASPRPFFLHVSYTAPHWGRGRNDRAGRRCATPRPFRFESARPKPAKRHASSYSRARLPRPPSFNEDNMSDKPDSVANKPRMGRRARRALAKRYRCELATLLAADEGVARINHALIDAGIEDETVVIFTSDNGYMHGEHRLRGGKVHPYEEGVRVPFLIKGPGIPAGLRTRKPVADVDLAPTILDLAGARATGRRVDGVSLLRTMRRPAARKRALLLQARRRPTRTEEGRFAARSWIGVRTRRYTYIERRSATVGTARAELRIGAGERVARELYDNKRDRFQLHSRHRSRRYKRARRKLADLLGKLRRCSGSRCIVEAAVPAPQHPHRRAR
jgi:N-acetylglucosamine-6-sulfatase